MVIIFNKLFLERRILLALVLAIFYDTGSGHSSSSSSSSTASSSSSSVFHHSGDVFPGPNLKYSPQNYLESFDFSPEQASHLLSLLYKRPNKGKIEGLLEVTARPLVALINDKKSNKALKNFNLFLIKKENLWNMFPIFYQAQMIIDQVIRDRSLQEVIELLGTDISNLNCFLNDSSTCLEFFHSIHKLKLPEQASDSSSRSSTYIPDRKYKATRNGKNNAGYLPSSPLLLYVDGKEKIIYSYEDIQKKEGGDDNALSQQQQMHLKYFQESITRFTSSNPQVYPEALKGIIGQLHKSTLPSVSSGEIWIKNPNKSSVASLYVSSSFANSSSSREIIGFSDDQGQKVNFVVTSPVFHESFAYCRRSTFKEDAKRPKPFTYEHKHINGSVITFDQGHGCDHADTIEHRGVTSTRHPKNFTPQNSYYNRNIRNHLVRMIRSGGGKYREISIYHDKPCKIDARKIPEGFVFIEYYEDGASHSYFFPNFVDYSSLEIEKIHTSNYLNFLDIFRIDALIECFFVPYIEQENPYLHINQKNKATCSHHYAWANISKLFDNLTEASLPPRARSSLMRAIMDQNINAAATLDFESLVNIATAINYYSKSRTFWELDDRWQEDKIKDFNTALPGLSVEIKQYLLENNLTIENNQEVINLSLAYLLDALEGSDQTLIKKIIGGKKIRDIELAKQYLDLAFFKIKNDQASQRDLKAINQILNYTDSLKDDEKMVVLSSKMQEEKIEPRQVEEHFLYKNYLDQEIINTCENFIKNVLRLKINSLPGRIDRSSETFSQLFEGIKILEKVYYKRNSNIFDNIISIFGEENELKEKIDNFFDIFNERMLKKNTWESSFEDKKRVADFFYYTGDPENQAEWGYAEGQVVVGGMLGKHLEESILKIEDGNGDVEDFKNIYLMESWIRSGSGHISKDIKLANKILKIYWRHTNFYTICCMRTYETEQILLGL